MINLPVKKLSQGMVTAQSIYNSKGASYLTKGTSLNDQYISRLKKLGVSHLTVTSINPSFHLLPPDDIVQEKTRVTAIHKVCDTFQEIEETGELNIDPLTEKAAKKIRQQCMQKIKSLEALVTGEFPEELQNIFTGTDGLFPKPSDIHFDCSCPDWADMCKHVAATMYAVGVRLDENPFYFFQLRGINADEFIAAAVDDRIESMLKHATDKSSRIIEEKEAHDSFGVL